MLSPNPWTQRYIEALRPGEIERRAAVPPVAVSDVEGLPTEVVCARLYAELNRMYVVTAAATRIIAVECERALAHALTSYFDSRSVLRFGYEFPALEELPEPYIPTFLTGPAGVGKSALRGAISRVLAGNTRHVFDPAHPALPLIDFVSIAVRGQRSAGGLLRQLASPEVSTGKVRVSEAGLIRECARWMRLCGTCLFAVDEMQSLTQSALASTLVTRVLLMLSEVRVPWIIVANYSLGHRLLRRPPEAVQRLLGRPVLMLPDAPGSADWLALLSAYDIVFDSVRAFAFVDRERELWNCTAGLKRLLRELTVQAYRLSRSRGSVRLEWIDISSAYLSREYSSSREEVEDAIASAAQGALLPAGARSPFSGADLDTAQLKYADSLRTVRQAQVTASVLDASLNAKDREILAAVASRDSPHGSTATNVLKLRRKRLTPAELQAAGRQHLESLGDPKKEPNSPA